MDLIGGYLLVMLILFTGNIALLLGNNKINNIKFVLISILYVFSVFLILNISSYFNIELLDYFTYIFLIISILLFITVFYVIKNNKLKLALYIILAIFFVSMLLFGSNSSLNYFELILYSLLSLVIFFVVFKLSILLHHAKRQYSVIIGEYMCLSSILIFIFALTYNYTLNLDYSMFTPFLILTPTYQVIYVLIAVFAILVFGVLLNDAKGGNS